MRPGVDLNEVTDRVSRFVEAAEIPALALGIVADSQLMYEKGFGKTHVSVDTLFPSCSTGKTITATAVMKLVEEGLLDLERPILGYLPEIKFPSGGSVRGVTLKHLLSHTSGLSSDPDFAPRFFDHPSTALRDHVFEDIPSYAALDPGDVLVYSNPGFNLAGFIAAEVCGQAFPALVDEAVLQPLGMSKTTFDPDSQLAMEIGPILRDEFQARPPPISYPAGGAVTTVRDLCRLAICHLDGGADVLHGESIGLMHVVHADAHCRSPRWYGLGFDIEMHKGRRLVTHGGGGFGCGSNFVLCPEEGVAIVALFNHPAGYGIDTKGILNELLGDVGHGDRTLDESAFHVGHGDRTLDESAFQPGTFQFAFGEFPGHPKEITLREDSGKRWVEIERNRHNLLPHDESVFLSEDESLSVGFAKQGAYAILDPYGIGLVSAMPYVRVP